MEKISLFKSSTGHYFENRESCEAWEQRVSELENIVFETLKDDISKSERGDFPEELLSLISNIKVDQISIYLSAFSKIAYWFKNSALDYNEGFVCFKDQDQSDSYDWLKRHRSKIMD